MKSSFPYSSDTDMPQAFENAPEITFKTEGNLLATAYMPIAANPNSASIIGLLIPSTNHHIIELGIKGTPYFKRSPANDLSRLLIEKNLYEPETIKE